MINGKKLTNNEWKELTNDKPKKLTNDKPKELRNDKPKELTNDKWKDLTNDKRKEVDKPIYGIEAYSCHAGAGSEDKFSVTIHFLRRSNRWVTSPREGGNVRGSPRAVINIHDRSKRVHVLG